MYSGAALCKANILRGVGRLNEKLYKKLVPNYPLGCKRICISNSYYPALARPHVDVIREEVVSVSPEGYISTSDGTTRHVDVIICATGYEQMTTHWFNPVKIFVKEDEIEEGDGIDVTKGLRQDPNFYLGIMTDTLPNMFFIYGPYSLIPHFSAVFCIEYQMNWIVTVLKRMRKMVAGKLERNRDQYQNVVVCVKESAQTDDVRNVRDKMKNTIHGGSVPCNAWNVDKTTGQNLTTFSGAAKDFWWKCRRVRFQDLEFNLTPATHPG
ncbi:baeyer-Villiger monooxygenase [Folsomia candida]|uniref:baeyer-Villiger monooxygenase n=1 Tax=Folsomia candida TaxID=158441 RepID=UPI001604DE94|nr:baeyer-Villiger monooxygenase [Folsomia candida]